MSRIIATAAIRGAHACVQRAETMLREATARQGRDAAVGFDNTAYALPVILALTGQRVEKVGDLEPVLETARAWLPQVPTEKLWLPYLGDTLDAGAATLQQEIKILSRLAATAVVLALFSASVAVWALMSR